MPAKLTAGVAKVKAVKAKQSIRVGVTSIPFYLFGQNIGSQNNRNVAFNQDLATNHVVGCRYRIDHQRPSWWSLSKQLESGQLEEEAKRDLGGYYAIVPGSPDENALSDRITAENPARGIGPYAF